MREAAKRRIQGVRAGELPKGRIGKMLIVNETEQVVSSDPLVAEAQRQNALDAARKLLAELKAAYDALPAPHRRAVSYVLQHTVAECEHPALAALSP